MTTSDQEDQAERRRVLANDARVRNSANTNGDIGIDLSHIHSEVGGRFAVTEHQTITGVVSPAPPPLPANSPWAGSDPVPNEPPLGYRIDSLDPSLDPEPSSPSPVQATDDPAHAPSGGSLVQQPYGGLMSARAGSSPLREAKSPSSEEQSDDAA